MDPAWLGRMLHFVPGLSVLPAQYVLPFFLLLPLVWLQNMPALERVPFRPVFGASVLAMVVFFCQQRIEGTQAFLASFRSEESVSSCFAIGRYLDRTVPMDEHPTILMTNLAYIPPRFTYVKIHNVDLSPALLDKNRFDYVITTDNMYSVYADKPTAGCERQFCPVYKVHYVDVVDTYTKFKHHTYPDYRYVASFHEFHLFERIHRGESESRHASNQ
jgi:hypothetical protein